MEKFYNRLHTRIRKNKDIETFIIFLCKCLPFLIFVFYAGIIFYVVLVQSHLLFYTIGIPLSIFIFVTILRKVWNRPRPYERLNINPLFKNKVGESTPSRHTASAFAIALTGYVIAPELGIILIVIAIFIAISRVVAGVHYIFDIVLAIFLVFFVYWLFLLFFPL